jgi:hypothetical protein
MRREFTESGVPIWDSGDLDNMISSFVVFVVVVVEFELSVRRDFKSGID